MIMRITKIGHCCLVIEEDGVRLLTDPGAWSSGQELVEGLDAILITHEHGDHLHIESLKQVLTNNTKVRVITNTAVGNIIKKEGIDFEVVEDGETTNVSGMVIEGYGNKHATIKDFPPIDVQNTGYFIGERLYYPGDALHKIGKSVDILALPVSGPWMKIEEAITYAKEVSPKHAFPVHDGMIIEGRYTGVHAVPLKILPDAGIDFVVLGSGESIEFP